MVTDRSEVKGDYIDPAVSRGDVFHFILYYLPILIISALLSMLVCYAYMADKSPSYQAEAQVMVERNLSPTLRSEVLPDAQLTDVINTEVLLVKAPPTLVRAIDALGLAEEPLEDKPNDLADFATRKDIWVDNLSRKLVIRSIPDSNIFKIAIQNEDPHKAASIVNAVLDAYLEQRLSIFSGGKESLVHAAEVKAAQAELDDLNEELRRLGGGSVLSTASTIQNTLAAEHAQLTANKLTAQSRRVELLETYFSDHPKIQKLDVELKSIEGRLSQISSEISRLDRHSRDAVNLRVRIQAAEQQFLNASAQRDRAELTELQNSELANVRVVFRASAPIRPVISFRMMMVIAAAIGLFIGVCLLFVTQYFRKN